MRGDGWDNLIFDDWNDYEDYCEAVVLRSGNLPSTEGRRVIIGGLPYGPDGQRESR